MNQTTPGTEAGFDLDKITRYGFLPGSDEPTGYVLRSELDEALARRAALDSAAQPISDGVLHACISYVTHGSADFDGMNPALITCFKERVAKYSAAQPVQAGEAVDVKPWQERYEQQRARTPLHASKEAAMQDEIAELRASLAPVSAQQGAADCHEACGHIGAECDFPACKGAAKAPAAQAVAAKDEQPQANVLPPTRGTESLLNADELAALRRFDECAQDGEGYDVPKEMMQRLAEIGVVRRKSGAYYEATEFGQYALSYPAGAAKGGITIIDHDINGKPIYVSAGAATTSNDARDAARILDWIELNKASVKYFDTLGYIVAVEDAGDIGGGKTALEAIRKAMSAHQAKKDQTNG